MKMMENALNCHESVKEFLDLSFLIWIHTES